MTRRWFPADRLGSSDCEELGDGWLVQPVNSLSSLAFVAVGVAVLGAMAVRPVDRLRSSVYAACVAAIGVGSVLFHGPQPAGSQLAHDVPILVTAWFIAIHDVRLISGRPRHDLAWFAFGAAAVTAGAVVEIGVIPPLTGLVVAVVVVAEVVIGRRRLRARRDGQARHVVIAVVAVTVVAIAAWLLGRTGSPLCDPDGLVQLHGLWHLLSAAVFGLWWWLAFWIPADPAAADGVSRPARLSTASRPDV